MSNKQSKLFRTKDSLFLTIDIQDAVDKGTFFKKIAQKISKMTGTDKKDILQSIKGREELKNTAFYCGLAFPHIILDYPIEPKLIVCKLKNSIKDWQCIDKTMVNTCLILLISKNMTKDNASIKRMTTIFKKFADDKFVSEISKCNSAKEVKEKL